MGSGPGRGRQAPLSPCERSAPQAPLAGPLARFEPLRLRLVSDRAEAGLWNELLERYHPPGLSPAHRLPLRDRWTGWQAQHGVRPVLAETYVSQPFAGTCHRASNWHYLGQTQARAAMRAVPAKTPKAIFVYPLQRDWQAILLAPQRPGRSR